MVANETAIPRREQVTGERPGRGRKGRVFLLDGTALAYRGHFALIRQPLLTSKGQNVSALYIFAMTLLRILEQEHPEYIAVAFDPKGDTFRHQQFADYKATRDKAPDEMVALFPAIRDLVRGFRLPILEVAGYEADDVIATVALEAAKQGHEVLIVTGDKDFLQIVSPRIKLYNVLKQGVDVEIQGEDAALAKFGVAPDKVIDVLALMGDSSDNVPGVPGVGPKTATELIQRFGSVEELYARLPEIERATLRQKLEAGHESAMLSKQLVTFDCAAPAKFDERDFHYDGPDPETLTPLLREYEMTSLIDRLALVAPTEDEHEYHVVATAQAFEELLARLARAGAFVFDTETTGLDPLRADLVGVALAIEERAAYYVPTNAEPRLYPHEESERQAIADRLKPLLEDPAIAKRAQNGKYDALVMRKYGVRVRGLDFDTMIASYCVSPGELQHNLDHLAMKHLNFRKIPTSDLIGKGKNQRTMDMVPIADVARYACEDVDVTARLVPILDREMARGGVSKLFHEVEMPLVAVLEEMEATGIRVDVELLATLSQEFERRIIVLEREIHELAGEKFNVNSPKQLGELLFDRLEIHKHLGQKKPRRTQTGWSTDAATLEVMQGHPIVQHVLDYRGLVKLKSTYVDQLSRLVNPDTGRIHTSFNQTVAATGRLSSSDPNLQNIPIRTEEGQKIRRAFVPGGPDRVLLSADYSQIELRLLAHLSCDANLRMAFREGRDIHRSTAALIFSLPESEVTPVLRSRAKAINFGVIYGMGAQRLAGETGLSVKEAQHFIDAYFETFSGVKAYLDATLEKARRDGFVTTLLGRRRYLTELDSPHPRVAAQARNVAINTPIQGTAADLIKVAMIRLHHEIERRCLKSRMILQVHDELVFDTHRDELDELRPLVIDVMESALAIDVPLVVEVGVGENWLEAH
jgi:DNA polymerase-1